MSGGWLGAGNDWLFIRPSCPGNARKKAFANWVSAATSGKAALAADLPVETAASSDCVTCSFVFMVLADFDVLENTQRVLGQDGG